MDAAESDGTDQEFREATMNREDIRNKLLTLPFERKDYWLVTGGAMVWYGFRSETNDVDLGCTKELADRLEAEGIPFAVMENGKRRFRFSEDIELFESWMQGETAETDGFSVVSVVGLISMKRALGRDKDIRDVELILNQLRRDACVL
ncbi:MAG: hypothetical protein IKR07_04325 [Oscillospiraceae bacterium]|nr:hypothetical protein [Oscillospiraceae bacterium]